MTLHFTLTPTGRDSQYTHLHTHRIESGTRREFGHIRFLLICTAKSSMLCPWNVCLSSVCRSRETKPSSWATCKGHILWRTEVMFSVFHVEPQQSEWCHMSGRRYGNLLTLPSADCRSSSGNYAHCWYEENSKQDNWHPVSLFQPMTAGCGGAFKLGRPRAIGCEVAKTCAHVKWARTGQETDLPASHKQGKVLCVTSWCVRNSFRVWMVMQFYFDSICKVVLDVNGSQSGH